MSTVPQDSQPHLWKWVSCSLGHSSTAPKWLTFALPLCKSGDLLSDVALFHWNYLLLYIGVAWHLFCHFVPGCKTSLSALLITLAYHSDVYFLVALTMVSLWRTKPCTRNSLFNRDLNTKDLVHFWPTDKKAKLKSAHYTFGIRLKHGEKANIQHIPMFQRDTIYKKNSLF